MINNIKLYDFLSEFSRFKKSDPEIGFNKKSIGRNLFRTYNGKIYFKSLSVRCENCEKKDIVLNATVNRKLIFLNIGEQDCLVQQFQCKKLSCYNSQLIYQQLLSRIRI